jgi:hypothetical protein
VAVLEPDLIAFTVDVRGLVAIATAMTAMARSSRKLRVIDALMDSVVLFVWIHDERKIASLSIFGAGYGCTVGCRGTARAEPGTAFS